MSDTIGLGKYNNSKKISELKASDIISYNQENSWIPIAQRNYRTGAYTNLAINVESIVSYSIEASYSYSAYLASYYAYSTMHSQNAWLNLLAIDNDNEITLYNPTSIHNSNIANKIVSYSFAYTINKLGWQYCIGNTLETSYQTIPNNSEEIITNSSVID